MASNSASTLLINLQEISSEGKEFICTPQTGELNEVLQDLLGKSSYYTQFTIRPLNPSTYELVGNFKTMVPEDCSRCGLDFVLDINENFKEMLLPELDQPRNSKYSKVNHFSDMHNEGPSVHEYQGHHLDMGEYLHEVIALALPMIPSAPVDADGTCKTCGINIHAKSFDYDEELERPESESPFSALKNIKLS